MENFNLERIVLKVAAYLNFVNSIPPAAFRFESYQKFFFIVFFQTGLDESKEESISRSELLAASCLLINALTVLDIVLSRRTKPWKFVLRILYRVARSNLKWAFLWMAVQLWSQFEGNRTTDTIQQLPYFSSVVHQLQMIWNAVQSYPVVLAVTFLVYNLVVSWVVHRRRSDGPEGAAPRRILSKWSLLVNCLFRPLSFDTAHSLMDFELDENVELLIERLALPNLWLTPTVPTDYVKYLPVWRYDSWTESYESNMKWIPCADCAICLDKYRTTVDVCGLPCGHQFHHDCIMVWLQRDNHHCPICRWPAYQNKYLSIM